MESLTALLEGELGPGSEKAITIANKAWKCKYGATENKRRPESLYIVLSTWIKPKLSVVRAKSNSTDSPEELASESMKQFKSEVKAIERKLSGFFDSNYFDPASVIFTIDFAETRAAVGKFQFLEIELNVETVNDIDMNGIPIPSKSTGKLNSIPFKDFEPKVREAVEKILKMDVFSNTELVEFSQSKKG